MHACLCRPYNYFDIDAAKDLREARLFTPDPVTHKPVVVDYGMLPETDIQCTPSYSNIEYDGFTLKPAGGRQPARKMEKKVGRARKARKAVSKRQTGHPQM